MQLLVASNFDDELLRAAADYPVVCFFAKLPSDLIGGGRSTFTLPPITRKQFEAHVNSARKLGFEFNYLLNGACLDNRELTPKGKREIHKTLQWITEIGITATTVTSPLLLRIIKKNYPQLKVRVSVFANIDHPRKLEYWENNGADAICLRSFTVNRDLKALKSLRRCTNLELELLANGNCIQSCSLDVAHMNLSAHSSQCGHEQGGYILDHCVLECAKAKVKNPVNYLRSDWIRPEDIHLYEDLGYHTFKLVDRSLPTDIMVNRIKAYTERKYDGNLINLIQTYGHKKTTAREAHYKRGSLKRMLHFMNPLKNNPELSKKTKALANLKGMHTSLSISRPIYIDNRKLDGFLEGVWKRECRYTDCDQCGYCHEFAKEAVAIDETYRIRCLELHRDIENILTQGHNRSRRLTQAKFHRD